MSWKWGGGKPAAPQPESPFLFGSFAMSVDDFTERFDRLASGEHGSNQVLAMHDAGEDDAPHMQDNQADEQVGSAGMNGLDPADTEEAIGQAEPAAECRHQDENE